MPPPHAPSSSLQTDVETETETEGEAVSQGGREAWMEGHLPMLRLYFESIMVGVHFTFLLLLLFKFQISSGFNSIYCVVSCGAV